MDFDLSEEQVAFRDTARDWVEKNYPKHRARELEAREGQFPYELWKDLAAAGFHGIGIAEEYGGQGGDSVTQSILARELARTLGGLAGVWGVSSFAGGKTLMRYGTEAQKRRFLPKLAQGEIRFSISITEPSGGTDLLGGMRTTITRVSEGWRVNGQKVWTSGATAADYFVVLGRRAEAEGKRSDLTSLIVPADTPGIDIRPIPKLGMRSFSSCEVYYDDVFVPEDLLVGAEGRGWHQLLPTLNNERILTASFALGVLDGVLEDAVEYMKTRSAFGQPIGRFQALQEKVADMVAWQHQSELLIRRAAWLQSLDRPCGVEATLAHLVSSGYANRAADYGIQILGGMGYSMEADMQRYWRDSRLFRIAPITEEMARNMLAESQGLPRSF
jgi:acyl-CoA dehydrogenase